MVAAEEIQAAAIWSLEGTCGVALQHLLWRLSENKTMPLMIQLRGSCTWPSCDAGCIQWTMRLQPKEPKPQEAYCPLCGRCLQVLAAGPLMQ
jgi:hypothetical protein